MTRILSRYGAFILVIFKKLWVSLVILKSFSPYFYLSRFFLFAISLSVRKWTVSPAENQKPARLWRRRRLCGILIQRRCLAGTLYRLLFLARRMTWWKIRRRTRSFPGVRRTIASSSGIRRSFPVPFFPNTSNTTISPASFVSWIPM